MKVLWIKKRYMMVFGGLMLALAIFWAVNSSPSVAASVATRQLPIYCVDRDDNVISISFDAAWGAVILRQLLLLPDSYHGGNTMNCVEFW